MSELPPPIRELIEAYEVYQNELPIVPSSPELHDLVRFNGNKKTPIHGWFTYKEGFSANLLPWVCETLKVPLESVDAILDPFVGSGTSLLSAQMNYKGTGTLHAYGVEHNPFVRFVAQAKLSWPEYSPDRILEYIPKIISARTGDRPIYPLPELSTLQNPRVFTSEIIQELLDYQHIIREELAGTPEEQFFLLGWAAVIERVSGVRKDGRALRFVEKTNTPKVAQALEDQWLSMLRDLLALRFEDIRACQVETKVLAGDGRTLELPEIATRRFDIILYSPPYLNNIDYSEVYKLELWLLNHVTSSNDFRRLRMGTLRSHPSLKFPETNFIQDLPACSWPRRLQELLIQALPNDEHKPWRIRLMYAYMDDMYQALSAQFRIAQRGANVICVVGNSLHGRKPHPVMVATDLLIAALAQSVGFTVENLQVARQLRRRDHENAYLRETIITMRRMGGHSHD